MRNIVKIEITGGHFECYFFLDRPNFTINRLKPSKHKPFINILNPDPTIKC